MLCLGRKIGESVMIGDDIKVVVLDINKGSVRLGFEADTSIEIHRKEVYNAIKRDEAKGL